MVGFFVSSNERKFKDFTIVRYRGEFSKLMVWSQAEVGQIVQPDTENHEWNAQMLAWLRDGSKGPEPSASVPGVLDAWHRATHPCPSVEAVARCHYKTWGWTLDFARRLPRQSGYDGLTMATLVEAEQQALNWGAAEYSLTRDDVWAALSTAGYPAHRL